MDQVAEEKPQIFSVLDVTAGYYGMGWTKPVSHVQPSQQRTDIFNSHD